MREDDFAPPVGRRRQQATREERRRRLIRVGAGASLIAFVLGIVVGSSAGNGGETTQGSESAGPPELPRGGRSLLPEYRLVGFYGAPQDDALGALGIGSPADAAKALAKQT